MGMVALSQRSQYYPEFAVRQLNALHGRRWADLIDWVARLPGSDPQVMAFTRTVRQVAEKIGDQVHSPHDPFCALCTTEVLARSAASEDDLLARYHRNLQAVTERLKSLRRREIARGTNVAIA